MAQRSLLLRLTPPKTKVYLDKCEESDNTPSLNAKEYVVAPSQRVSKRLVTRKDKDNCRKRKSDVDRKRIIDNFFSKRKPKHDKHQSPVVSLNKVRMQRDQT